MPQRNNIIVATIFLALIFLAAIPMDWLTTSAAGSDSTVTGRTGNLVVPGVASLPIWLLLCGSAAVTLLAGFNCVRATALPFLPLVAVLAGGGAFYMLPFFINDNPMQQVSVSIGIGPFVAMAATVAAILLALRRPIPTPLYRRSYTRQRTSLRHAAVRH